jgi:hypothetical protein
LQLIIRQFSVNCYSNAKRGLGENQPFFIFVSMLRKIAIGFLSVVMLYHVLPIAVFHQHSLEGVHTEHCKEKKEPRTHLHAHDDVHCNFCLGIHYFHNAFTAIEKLTCSFSISSIGYNNHYVDFLTSNYFFSLRNKAPPVYLYFR